MRKALATINFGDNLSGNARASFQDAARRWGAQYVEITPENGAPGLNPFRQKYRLFDLLPADRVVYIDADAIIRNDVPPLFEVCPRDRFCAVPDVNPHQPFPEYTLRIIQQEHERLTAALGRSIPAPYFFSTPA